jgi:hypothetical protein
MTAGAKLAVLEYDLEIPQAADWPGVAFPIFNPDGSLADLTGCSVAGAIRPLRGSDELYFTWSSSPTTGQGLITINTGSSTVTPRVLATESSAWTFSDAVYDIVLTNPTAPVGLRKTRVVMGAVTVSFQVTP